MAKIWPEKYAKQTQTLLLFIWLKVHAHCCNFWLSNYRVITKTGRAGICCLPWRLRIRALPWTPSTGSSPIVWAWLNAREVFCNFGCFVSPVQWQIYRLHLFFLLNIWLGFPVLLSLDWSKLCSQSNLYSQTKRQKWSDWSPYFLSDCFSFHTSLF